MVDNTVCASKGTSGVVVGSMPHDEVGSIPRNRAVEAAAGEPRSISIELVAWLRSSVRLAEARWRLARQRWINRHGSLLPAGWLAGLAPVVGLAAFVVFGALFGLRFAQESSSGSLDGSTGSVAAVAASTSGGAASPSLDDTARLGSTVVVHPGDSLWSIAVSRYPEHDPRAVVDAFVEANGAAMIRAGQQLVVPSVLLQN